MSDIAYTYEPSSVPIVSAPDAIECLGARLDDLGVRRVLVVCGPNILRDSDVVQRAERAAGARVVGRFAGAAPHSPVKVLRAGLAEARPLQVDALLSVGGGSTLAVAKALALLLDTDRSIEDFADRFEPPDRALPPLVSLPSVRIPVIAIPTTMGGAEMASAVGGFLNEDHTRKIIVGGNASTSTRLVVIDGRALRTTPVSVLSGSAMGQLRVAIETYASPQHNPVSDAMALHAARTLWHHLQGDWSADIGQLLRIKGAGVLASMATSALTPGVGRMGINSAIARQLGAICGVGHGEANAILLPHTIVFNVHGVGERFRRMAEALGVGASKASLETLARLAADRVAQLSGQLGVPARLRDLEISAEALEIVATATMGDDAVRANPVPITDRGQVLELLRAAW